MKMKTFPALCILLLSLIFITGCDDRDSIDYEIISMTVEPEILYADSISTTNSRIIVTVADENGDSVENVAVYFETDIGEIWEKEYTDEHGIAETNFYDIGITGTAHITAYLKDDEENSFHRTIEIYPYPNYSITQMTASPTEIYADEGITQSEIAVLVKDQDGIFSPNQEVNFSSDMGIIDSPVITNELGIARAFFRDTGQIGIANITASIGISDSTISVIITPTLPVLDVHFQAESYNVSVDDITMITANASNIAGIVPDGSVITFTTTLGYFQSDYNNSTNLGQSVSIMTESGMASAWLNAGQESGNSQIYAASEGVMDTAELNVSAGEPAEMELHILDLEGNPQDIILAGSSQYLYAHATIHDEYGNPIDTDSEVTFQTSLGTIENPVFPDENGTAVSVFSPGSIVGTAQITARAGNVIEYEHVEVIADNLDHLFFHDNQWSLPAGSNFSIVLTVDLLDAFENPVLTPMEVWFKFVNRPEANSEEGSNLNNEVYNLTDSTSTISSEGQASVTVYPGTSVGNLVIEAWCRPQPGTLVSTVSSNITVVAGYPDHVILNIGEMDTGEDLGDGTWEIQASALVLDAWDNPVDDGCAVYFYLSEAEEYVTLTQQAYVGNTNMQNNTTAGTAFTTLVFEGGYTNETITLNVDVANFTTSHDFSLPLQFGEITMVCVPSHIDWTEYNSTEEILYTQCMVYVHDGQNNPVNKQRVVFNTTLGFPTDEGEHGIHPTFEDIENNPNFQYLLEIVDFTGINEEYPQDETDGYTGPFQSNQGRLVKDVGFYKYECPEPIPSPPGMTTGEITARIADTTITVDQNITLFRYFD